VWGNHSAIFTVIWPAFAICRQPPARPSLRRPSRRSPGSFDLLYQDGVDLRALPLSDRKRDLRRLCRKSLVPFMREVQTFPNGTPLVDHGSKFDFEGVVSKRLTSHYLSGPSRNWVKTKCPGWKRINSERHKLFEGPRKPEQN
jgi:bifunctional non-homologous end joining protein LigD